MSTHAKRATFAEWVIEDPGTGAALPHDQSGTVEIYSTAAAETNTLAAPVRAGVVLILNCYLLDAAGTDTRVVTVTNGYDVASSGTDSTLTLDTQGGFVVLQSFKVSATEFEWRITGYDAVAGPSITFADIFLNDNNTLKFGDSNDVMIDFSTADSSNHTFVIAISDSSQQMHITDKGARATDWARSAGTHPELSIHSNTTPATDYLAIGNHDGTTATIDVVGGTTLAFDIAGTNYAGVKVTGLHSGTYVEAGTAGTDQVTIKSTGTAPASTGANVGHLYADFETDDDELFWLSGTIGTATQLTT